jgi:glycosyltransferase involved in cell wall biosynthesis
VHTNYRFVRGSVMGRFIRIMLARFDLILALSEAAAADLVSLGIEARRVVAYHNWVDESVYHIQEKGAARRKLHLDENKFYALFAGRFSPEKGIFDLVKAVPSIAPGVNLLIAGGGPGEDKLQSACKGYANVSFLGRLSQDILRDYCAAADILVYAPVDEDYLGRVAIGALMCGLPVMIADSSEYLGNRKNVTVRLPQDVGISFENTPVSFARALNSIFEKRGALPFNAGACSLYARQWYGKAANGAILYNALVSG